MLIFWIFLDGEKHCCGDDMYTQQFALINLIKILVY